MPSFQWLAAGLAWVVMHAAQAVEPAQSGLRAADPDQPSSAQPLTLPPMGLTAPAELPADIEQARAIWQRANQRVAEFPRGHIDLLQWEARQPAPAATGTPASPPGTPMTLAEALRESLGHRPELFVRAGMNAPEIATVRVDYAMHVRALQGAWIDAVSARQRLRLQSELLEATRAGSELGQRMVTAGNWSQARLNRERLLQATAWQNAVQAQAAAVNAQEQLARLLGIWQADAVVQLAARLPDSLPATPPRLSLDTGLDAGALEAAVLRSHPTIGLERLEAQRLSSALNQERRQAWQQALDAALAAMPEPDLAGALEPPRIDDLSLLRDHGLERATRTESALLKRVAKRRSSTREARARLQVSHAMALHAQDVVVELQSAQAQDSLLRYNGMLQSTWELLASARDRLAALDEAVQARRDFWRAQADWQALLAGAD